MSGSELLHDSLIAFPVLLKILLIGLSCLKAALDIMCGHFVCWGLFAASRGLQVQPAARSQQLPARSLLGFAWELMTEIGDELSSANNASECACDI